MWAQGGAQTSATKDSELNAVLQHSIAKQGRLRLRAVPVPIRLKIETIIYSENLKHTNTSDCAWAKHASLFRIAKVHDRVTKLHAHIHPTSACSIPKLHSLLLSPQSKAVPTSNNLDLNNRA